MRIDMMLELTIALGLASSACCVLFMIQSFLENREREKMKRELEELENLDLK